MAWIAVHEQIDGAKLRQLKKAIGCSKMEAIGILVTLWLWSINNANRNGELCSADCEDVAEVFALSLSAKITPKDVVAALIKTGWLDEVGDRLFVHDWADWQDQWFKALDAREKDRARKRAAAERQQRESGGLQLDFSGISAESPKEFLQKFCGNSTENPVQPSPLPSPLPLPLPSPPSSEKTSNQDKVSSHAQDKPARDADFDLFWAAYPKKKAKGDAQKAFKKVKAPIGVILSAVEKQKQSEQWRRDGGRFIPYPATWLNGQRWEDETDTPTFSHDQHRIPTDADYLAWREDAQ